MTSKHPITCIAISAAVALKLFAGTADAGVSNGETDARQGRVLLTVLHDASGRPGDQSSSPICRIRPCTCSSAGAWISPGSTARSSTAR